MQIYTAIKFTFISSILVITSSFASATPILFNFTGTISDYILSNGVVQKSSASIPKWNGKKVSGSLILDLNGIAPAPNHPSQNYYASSDNNNFAQWLTFIINNPDGTSYTIAPPLDPLPAVDVNSASTYLTYSDVSNNAYDTAQFYAGRSYANLKKNPRQTIDMWLTAQGENSDKLLNTINFDAVTINPEYANWQNYGTVYYIKENGKKMAYTFSIDSFTRITSEVPESGSLSLLILGIAGLFFIRSIRTRQ